MRLGLSFVLATMLNAVLLAGLAYLSTNRPQASRELLISGGGTLKPADVVALVRTLGQTGSVSPVVSGPEPLRVGSTTIQAEVQGVEPNFQQIVPWQIDQGGFFTQQNDAAFAPVAVIDRSLAEQLFRGESAAIGQSLQIGDIPFTVIGVGSAAHSNTVLVPFRTGQVRLFGPTQVDRIVLQLSSPAEVDPATQQIEQLLRQRHSLTPGQPDDFSVVNAPRSPTSASPTLGEQQVLQLAQQVACVAKNACERVSGAQT